MRISEIISEVDATRRGLFRSAAAMAAVAAIPAAARAQAAELIRNNDPEILRAAIAVGKAGINHDTFEATRLIMDAPITGSGPERMFGDRWDDAVRHMTGHEVDEGGHEEFHEIIENMDPDQVFDLLKRTWTALGMGDFPHHRAYQLIREFPGVLGMEGGHSSHSWDLIRDFLPGSLDHDPHFRHGHHLRGDTRSGLERLEQNLARDMEFLKRYPDNIYVRNQVRKHQQQIDQIRQAQKIAGTTARGPASSTDQSTASSTGQSTAGGTKPRAEKRLSPVMQAVDTIFRALRRTDRIPDVALDMLAKLDPRNIRIGMDDPAAVGKEPSAPAALPAPQPGIDIGLDRQPSTVGKKND